MSKQVIEIDGCKITPEFVKLINESITQTPQECEQFKRSLFDVQTALLLVAADKQIDTKLLSDMAQSLNDIYNFADGVSKLREEGKF